MDLSPRQLELLNIARGAWSVLLVSRTPATRGCATDVWFDACEEALIDFRKQVSDAEQKDG